MSHTHGTDGGLVDSQPALGAGLGEGPWFPKDSSVLTGYLCDILGCMKELVDLGLHPDTAPRPASLYYFALFL